MPRRRNSTVLCVLLALTGAAAIWCVMVNTTLPIPEARQLKRGMTYEDVAAIVGDCEWHPCSPGMLHRTKGEFTANVEIEPCWVAYDADKRNRIPKGTKFNDVIAMLGSEGNCQQRGDGMLCTWQRGEESISALFKREWLVSSVVVYKSAPLSWFDKLHVALRGEKAVGWVVVGPQS